MRTERVIVACIAAGFVLLALLFSTGPIFEGPDEIEHYRYIRAVQQGGGLPDALSRPRSQFHQAPLYYLMLWPLAPLAQDGDFAAIDGRLNPYYPYLIGVPGNDNKNLYLHPAAERFPALASETARTVHGLRLISVLLGLGTLLVSAAIFRLLWPGPDQAFRRMIALAVVAFWPQFAYLSATLNNDNLLIFLGTATLYALLRLQRDGPGQGRAVALGIVTGAALLTKVSALFLIFPVAYVFLRDRRLWRALPVAGALAAAVAGWWYVRNVTLYGDPTAMQAMLRAWQGETIGQSTLNLDARLDRLEYSFRTLWATFGQGAVPVGPALYVLYDVLTALILGGVLLSVAHWLRERRRMALPRLLRRRITLLLWFGAAWVGALLYTSATMWSGTQGRYLLPAIAAWGALAGLGAGRWPPVRARAVMGYGMAVVLFAAALACVIGYFLPAYLPLPAQTEPGRVLRWPTGAPAELVGVTPGTVQARPGDTFTITLVWRASGPADADTQMYLHSVDSALVRRDSLPGTGNLLASDWRDGLTWAERYVISLAPDAAPGDFDLIAGVYDPATGTAFPARSPSDGDIRAARLVVEGR
ncbi:MAG: glycosyltransferase family 39 protein [Anaerolineae bacterium]|nr:glycosyltransferase family 39 protein [Anaerolineae bacterium]